MENKTPEKNKKDVWSLYKLEPRERMQMMIYYPGCMGAIVLVTFLIRWLVGVFKGF